MKEILKSIVIFIIGVITACFILSALYVSAGRNAGNFGGEVMVLPLMIGLIWFGWQLACKWIKEVYGKQCYKKGYAIGRYKYISEQTKEQ